MRSPTHGTADVVTFDASKSDTISFNDSEWATDGEWATDVGPAAVRQVRRRMSTVIGLLIGLTLLLCGLIVPEWYISTNDVVYDAYGAATRQFGGTLTLVVADDYVEGQTDQLALLVQGAVNDSLHISQNLNATHSLGLVNLINLDNKTVYTKAHRLMFETFRIFNSSGIEFTMLTVFGKTAMTFITQSNTGEWFVGMQNYTSCIIMYPADISPEGKYFARVDYDAGVEHCAISGYDFYSVLSQALAVATGKPLKASREQWLWPLYYNIWGRLSIATLTNALADRSLLREGELFIHVESSAKSWHHSMSKIGELSASEEMAVYQPGGLVYMTYPTDYLQHHCNNEVWLDVNPFGAVQCNLAAAPDLNTSHLTTANFGTRFPDSTVGTVITHSSLDVEGEDEDAAQFYTHCAGLEMNPAAHITNPHHFKSPIAPHSAYILGSTPLLAGMIATSHEEVYGDLPVMFHAFMCIFVLYGLLIVALLVVRPCIVLGPSAFSRIGTMEEEMEKLRHVHKQSFLCSLCIGVGLVMLIAMWIVENKKIQNYSDDWIMQRVAARQLLSKHLSATVILETFYANQLLDTARRLGLIVIGPLANTTTLQSTVAYMFTVLGSYPNLYSLGFGFQTGDYVDVWQSTQGHHQISSWGKDRQTEIATVGIATSRHYPGGGTGQRMVELRIPVSTLINMSWTAEEYITEALSLRTWSLYDPVYRPWYANCVERDRERRSDPALKSREFGYLLPNSIIDYLSGQNAIVYCLNIMDDSVPSQSLFPVAVQHASLWSDSVGQATKIAMQRDGKQLGDDYMVDSSGNLVSTTFSSPGVSSSGPTHNSSSDQHTTFLIPAQQANSTLFPNVKSSADWLMNKFSNFYHARGYQGVVGGTDVLIVVHGFDLLTTVGGQDRWTMVQMFTTSQFTTTATASTHRTYIYCTFGILFVTLVMSRSFKHLKAKIRRITFLYEHHHLKLFSTTEKTTIKSMMRSSFAAEIDGIEDANEATDSQLQSQSQLQASVRKVLVAHMHLAQSKDHGDVEHLVADFLSLAAVSPSLLCYSLFQETQQRVLLVVHAIRTSPYYFPIKTVAFVVLYVLEGWNDAEHGSNTFIICVLLEGLFVGMLSFNAVTTLILKQYEGWALNVLGDSSARQMHLRVTAAEANAAIRDWKILDHSPGTYISMGLSTFSVICFVAKLAGYYHLFSYARGGLLLVSDKTIRMAVVVMCKTLRQSVHVFVVVLLFMLLTTLMALVLLHKRWSDKTFSDSRFGNFNDFEDANVVMYILIAMGENYADIMDTVMKDDKGYFLFFGPISVFGIVFLLSLVAATFEAVYRKQQVYLKQQMYLEKMSGLAASFALWYVSCEQIMLEKMQQENDFEKLRGMLLEDARVPKEGVNGCQTVHDLRDLWDKSVVQKIEPEMTLHDFKQLINIMSKHESAKNEGIKLSEHQTAQMSQQAFVLLDTDRSGTISFDEFENIWGIFKTLSMLHGNEILRQELVLEQEKRQIAILAASNKESEIITEERLNRFSRSKDRLKLCKLSLSTINGMSDFSWGTVSLFIVIGHMMAVAFYEDTNSDDFVRILDWILRSMTVLQLSDAMFRLVGLCRQPMLTSRRRQRYVAATPLGRVWLATDHQYRSPRETINTRCMLLVCMLGFVAAVVDVIRIDGLHRDRYDFISTILRVMMILPTARIFLLLQQVNHLLHSFFVSLGPVVMYLKFVLILIYFFAVVGVDAFSEDCNQYFSDSITAFIYLIQMFIGEGWYSIMYDCIANTHKLAMFYFISFIGIVTIVFTSLFVSLVFALYGDIETQRRTGSLFVTISDELGSGTQTNINLLLGRLLEIDFGASINTDPESPVSGAREAPGAESKDSELAIEMKPLQSPTHSLVYNDEKEPRGSASDPHTWFQHDDVIQTLNPALASDPWFQADEDNVLKAVAVPKYDDERGIASAPDAHGIAPREHGEESKPTLESASAQTPLERAQGGDPAASTIDNHQRDDQGVYIISARQGNLCVPSTIDI